LFTAFKTEAIPVFIDTDATMVATEKMVDVVLSPTLYWVKRVTLPVKYLREVKKLLPSLFEDTLPEGKYSYSAYKEGDSYLIFAYKDREILDLLTEKGISPQQMRNVYLAQSEFSAMAQPLRLPGGDVLDVKDGVVIKLPSQLVDEAASIDLDGHLFSKHRIELARYTHIADRKSQFWFASFMVVLITLFTLEWVITASKSNAVAEEVSAVYAKYDLPATSIQNEAVLSKLRQRYERQTGIRDAVMAVLDVKLLENEALQLIEVVGNTLNVRIKTIGASRAKIITEHLTKQKLNLKHSFGDGELKVEVRL
jgi:hypothetical protein